MYAEPISFLVGIITVYGIILYQLYLLTWITITSNSIFIIFWRIVHMVSIKEEIIPNPPFQSSGPSFVILSIYRNMGFGDTR